MQFFDSHCHLDADAFDEDRRELWQQCHASGIDHLLIPGIDAAQWQRADQLCNTMTGLVYSAGLHPWFLPDEGQATELALRQLEHQLSSKRCVAIGECGLDALIEIPEHRQLALFEQQLQLACDTQRPLILHVRRRHSETLSLLKRFSPSAGGVIHAFSGSPELASQYWKLGFHIGIGGVISYERAAKTQRAAESLPLEAILLETDAPDMPLAGHQGQRNSPLQVIKVAQALSELRRESTADIAAQTRDNALSLFNI